MHIQEKEPILNNIAHYGLDVKNVAYHEIVGLSESRAAVFSANLDCQRAETLFFLDIITPYAPHELEL
jgi:hypothetical protein